MGREGYLDIHHHRDPGEYKLCSPKAMSCENSDQSIFALGEMVGKSGIGGGRMHTQIISESIVCISKNTVVSDRVGRENLEEMILAAL